MLSELSLTLHCEIWNCECTQISLRIVYEDSFNLCIGFILTKYIRCFNHNHGRIWPGRRTYTISTETLENYFSSIFGFVISIFQVLCLKWYLYMAINTNISHHNTMYIFIKMARSIRHRKTVFPITTITTWQIDCKETNTCNTHIPSTIIRWTNAKPDASILTTAHS